MKFSWKGLFRRQNRVRADGKEPVTAEDREVVRKQLQREMEVEREITRQRGMHGGGP